MNKWEWMVEHYLWVDKPQQEEAMRNERDKEIIRVSRNTDGTPRSVNVDGVEFSRFPEGGESVKILEVRPIYYQNGKYLDLRLEWPTTMLKPGMRMRISVEASNEAH